MSKLQLQVELNAEAIGLALRTVRVASGRTQVDAAAMLGLTHNGLQARESTRGIHKIDDIDQHLRTLGYKATLIITNIDPREGTNGTVRARNGIRNGAA